MNQFFQETSMQYPQVHPIVLSKFVPGTRPDVFKQPHYERNLNLYKFVQSIPSEQNRNMYKELKHLKGPDVLYTRPAITVGEFVTIKVLSAKPREKKSSMDSSSSNSKESNKKSNKKSASSSHKSESTQKIEKSNSKRLKKPSIKQS